MKNNKLVIYQLLPRLFGPDCRAEIQNGSKEENGCGSLNDLNLKALSKIKELGVTDIWITGLIRHASGTAYPDLGIEASHPSLLKGKAGSPYAIRDYYDIDPDLSKNPVGRMQEFKELLQRAGELDLGIFIDFVPNHVSRDYQSVAAPEGVVDLGADDQPELAFDPDNNFYYLPNQHLILPSNGKKTKKSDQYQEYPARVTGNDVFHNEPKITDWYETVKLNYAVDPATGVEHFYPIPDTWLKMIDILKFWAEKGIKGFRCDMAGMVPLGFWNYALPALKAKYPGLLFIAEIYEPHRYADFANAGFDYLYDKVGLYDATRSVIEGKSSTHVFRNVWQNLNGLDGKMLRFMENHDEQRVASKHFAGDPWKGLPGLALCALMNTGPILVYFGQELGEPAIGSSGFSGDDGRTSIFDYTAVPEVMKWMNQGNYTLDLLSEDQIRLRTAYQQILHLAGRNPIFSMGQFYDLMWINEDLPTDVRNQVYAFLRYAGSEIYVIAVSFSERIRSLHIRLSDHPLQEIGLQDQDRFIVKSLHPTVSKHALLRSQICSAGIHLTFDQTGWALARIEV